MMVGFTSCIFALHAPPPPLFFVHGGDYILLHLMVVELESSCTIKSVTAKQKIDATDHKCSVALEFGRWLVLQRSFILNIAC